MANLKEIRNRISVTSTMKITSAMKMVSAAKLKKAQDAITAMRPYSEKLTELMSSFSQIILPQAFLIYLSLDQLKIFLWLLFHLIKVFVEHLILM